MATPKPWRKPVQKAHGRQGIRWRLSRWRTTTFTPASAVRDVPSIRKTNASSRTICRRSTPKLLWADVVAVASPVYFYGVSAQLKAIIDRCHTPLRNQFHIQKLALLLVGGATLPTLFDAILCQYQMILDYFRLSDGGRVLVSGVRAPGEIAGHPELQAAYALGKNL